MWTLFVVMTVAGTPFKLTTRIGVGVQKVEGDDSRTL